MAISISAFAYITPIRRALIAGVTVQTNSYSVMLGRPIRMRIAGTAFASNTRKTKLTPLGRSLNHHCLRLLPPHMYVEISMLTISSCRDVFLNRCTEWYAGGSPDSREKVRWKPWRPLHLTSFSAHLPYSSSVAGWLSGLAGILCQSHRIVSTWIQQTGSSPDLSSGSFLQEQDLRLASNPCLLHRFFQFR